MNTSNTAPVVNISSPQDGATLFWADYFDGINGTNIPLQGSATDAEDGSIASSNLAWSYRLKGTSTWINIDTGATAVLNLGLSSELRTYEVRLSASDNGSPALEGEGIIEFTLIGPPS